MNQVKDIPPETRRYAAIDIDPTYLFDREMAGKLLRSGPPKTGRPNRRVIRLLRDPRTGKPVPPNYELNFHFTKGYRLVRTSMGQG